MKIEIKSRWNSETILFSCDAESIREALQNAVTQKADLRGADLRDADLRDADLRGADLRDADLRSADLRSADLCGADLCGADLCGADLRGADLRSADLCGADLCGADLRIVRDDLWAVLSSAPSEVEGLLSALKKGRVDGSTYQGECACLVGTLAKLKKCSYDAIDGLKPDSSRPAERFFLGINKGDKPETSKSSKLAVEWVETWLANMKGAFEKEAKATV